MECLTCDIPASVRFEYSVCTQHAHLFESSGEEEGEGFMGFTQEDL